MKFDTSMITKAKALADRGDSARAYERSSSRFPQIGREPAVAFSRDLPFADFVLACSGEIESGPLASLRAEMASRGEPSFDQALALPVPGR